MDYIFKSQGKAYAIRIDLRAHPEAIAHAFQKLAAKVARNNNHTERKQPNNTNP